MSERRPIPRKKTSTSSSSSRASYEGARRESLARNEHLNECKGAYLSVLRNTSEPLTSVEELSLALQFGGRNPSKKTLQKYWNRHTDELSYNEFCDIMHKEKPTSKETLLKAFKKIDINGDGFITFDELSSLLTMRGERMTKAEVQTILDDADYNKDGKLDYYEFCDMLTSTSEQCTKKNMKKLGISNNSRRVSDNNLISERKVPTGNANNERKFSTNAASSERKLSNMSSQKKLSQSNMNEERKSSLTSLIAREKSDSKILKKSSISTTDQQIKIPKTDLQEPQNLKTWTNVQSKGSFFLEDDGSIVSHHYSLVIAKESQLWLTVQPIPSRSAPSELKPVDTELFILSEKNGELVAFTAAKLGMKSCLECTLSKGKHHLVTFTTGCHLTLRKYEPTKVAKLIQGSGENLKLTQNFRTALTEIFTRSDLDSNGYLSRKEFDLFQMRTSGEHCDDDAWEVMTENFDMNSDEEITLKGFLDLNRMEAQDAEGGLDDLWVTIESMGYNKALELDQSCSFYMDIFVKNSKPTLTVIGVDKCEEEIKKALVSSVLYSGAKPENIKGMKDLFLYKYHSITRCSLIVENQSHYDITLRVNCNNSKNCISHRGDLDYTMEILSGNTEVAHHILPEDSKKQWIVKHNITIEK